RPPRAPVGCAPCRSRAAPAPNMVRMSPARRQVMLSGPTASRSASSCSGNTPAMSDMIPQQRSEYQHPVEPIDERILDAALEAVAAGASTMDDIALRAGVGRVTLFRRFGSQDSALPTLFAS